jgi:transposase
VQPTLRDKEPPVDVKAMHATIGQLTLDDFLETALIKAGLLSAKR